MTVVIAYRPDEYGQAALGRGVDEARLRGSRVVVVNASSGSAYVDKAYASAEQVAALEDALEAAGVPGEVRQPVGPDVAEQVLATAEDVDATLLVVGIRHRSPVGKMLLGSVAQRLLLDSPWPVFAVKPGGRHSDA